LGRDRPKRLTRTPSSPVGDATIPPNSVDVHTRFVPFLRREQAMLALATWKQRGSNSWKQIEATRTRRDANRLQASRIGRIGDSSKQTEGACSLMACKRSSVRARLAPYRKLLQTELFLLSRLRKTGPLGAAFQCPTVPTRAELPNADPDSSAAAKYGPPHPRRMRQGCGVATVPS
jgi:hypothetical protein